MRSRVCNLTEFVPDLTVERMAELLKEGFREEYGEYETYAFSPQEAEEVEKIYREQASWEWRLGRTPKFDFELDERFSFGEMQILFTMKSGAVIGVQVFSDALDTELAGRVQKALLGVRFTAEDLAGALREDGGQELLEIADYIAQYEL